MSSADGFSFDAFMERAQQRLLAAAPTLDIPPDAGDHVMDPGLVALQPARPPKPASVLVPIVPRPSGAHVLFTRRTAHLASHAGQISFPGGKIDAGDGGPLDAALREAEEEIGLARHHVAVAGYLDPYQTTTGYRIAPVVGIIAPPFELTPNAGEVDEIFEVPLGFLMNPANHQAHSREWQGAMRRYYAMPYGEYYIWGVTAGILRGLYEKVLGT